jgi:hypothetical protein
MKALRTRNIVVPQTLHTEYKAETEAERIEKTAQDFAFLRRVAG